ncbi:AraC family transcriptional regulator ligand-binding domain-containing protein [Bradyrhizobium jicamae]|uniref:AraC family transcriptional regulator ligand-binding domain-containing protein n=1 Tax=Bradyrhizobium jicamae TaxID=280332 RepID=A0ABS5FWX5_9BRAD|nr:AraC family transcriptional regulator [Bradyrhizobium jicamae]MBR0801314.1 AraC family transcriptional regulator ligand-binding domain-containing protein [Bradyrhizobium jicamae]
MPRLIRSATLSNYVEVARSVGLDPYRMITEFRLPPASLTDPEMKVSAMAVGRLLEASAERSGKSDFGLRLADQRTVANLGALALLVREQPTVRKALDVLVGYMFLHSESLHVNMREQSGEVILSLAIDVDRPVPIRQGIELGVGFLHRSLQQLFRERWKPQAVCFTHALPSKKDIYRKFFGTDVLFSQDFNGIVCSSRDIDASVPAADAKMMRYVQDYLDTLAVRPGSSMSASVSQCIYTMLPSGLCSADSVAARLGVDRRTVHRHLAREGKTFSAMLDSVRAELVTRYIGNSERPLASIAELLGFSALSAFSRWFRSQFGCSVSQWRAGQRTALANLDPPEPRTSAD